MAVTLSMRTGFQNSSTAAKRTKFRIKPTYYFSCILSVVPHSRETGAIPDINVIKQSFGLGAPDGDRRAGSSQCVAGFAAVWRY